MKSVTRSGHPKSSTWLILAGGFLFLASTWSLIGPSKGSSLAGTFSFLSRFATAPDFSYLPSLGQRMGETLLLAWAGTILAMLVAFPASLLAAKTTTPSRWFIGPIRLVASLFRAVPDLLLAMILASSIGLGPAPGVAALAIASIGFLIKNYADALEVVAPGPIEAVAACGGDETAQRSVGVLPQAAPDLINLSLLILDSNVRSSAILGAVGAGGIGYDIQQAARLFQFERLGLILIAIYFTVTLIDRLSGWVRRRIA